MAKKAADVRATKPEEPFIRALTEQAGKVPVTHLFFRGDHGQPKAAVKPADLSVVALNKNPIPENDGRRPSTGRRLALAKRLTDGTHPLTGPGARQPLFGCTTSAAAWSIHRVTSANLARSQATPNCSTGSPATS